MRRDGGCPRSTASRYRIPALRRRNLGDAPGPGQLPSPSAPIECTLLPIAPARPAIRAHGGPHRGVCRRPGELGRRPSVSPCIAAAPPSTISSRIPAAHLRRGIVQLWRPPYRRTPARPRFRCRTTISSARRVGQPRKSARPDWPSTASPQPEFDCRSARPRQHRRWMAARSRPEACSAPPGQLFSQSVSPAGVGPARA